MRPVAPPRPRLAPPTRGSAAPPRQRPAAAQPPRRGARRWPTPPPGPRIAAAATVDNAPRTLSRPVKIVAIAPAGAPSPVARGEAGVTWGDVLAHEAVRLAWADAGLGMIVLDEGVEGGVFDEAVKGADVLAFVGGARGAGPAASLAARPSADAVPTLAAFDCAPSVTSLARVGGAPVGGPLARALARLPWSRSAAAARATATARAFWARGHSDDVLTALLILVDAGVERVARIDSLRGRGLGTLACMLRHCRESVLACVTDPDCKAGLDCLTACPPGDQVGSGARAGRWRRPARVSGGLVSTLASTRPPPPLPSPLQVCAYRCIVSHESPEFAAFSLCVLTRHGCLGVSASIPSMPAPEPQAEWRGEAMSVAVGHRIFVGWLAAGDPWSWRVAAGQNPAYDQFGNQARWRRGRGREAGATTRRRAPTPALPPAPQIQLFYHGAAKGTFWYDPVFQVTTLGGETVWRRRHYRVRPGPAAGVFLLSVLDNGVVSQEVWRIVDCPDDLSYALFAYVGAAAAAGQAYTGAVLCTRDGAWPPAVHADRLAASLERAGVKTWELFRVASSDAAGAPLAIDGRDAEPDPVRGRG